MRMIESKQTQLIHIAKAQIGLSEEDYRACIEAQTKGKKNSSKDLTYFEADRLIDYFKTLGFKIKSNYIRTSGAARRARYQHVNDRRRRGHEPVGAASCREGKTARIPGTVVRLPTRDQLDMIDVLAGKIVWRVEGGLKLWMKRYLKIERIKSVEDAQACIEGLKGVLAHQQRAEEWNNG